MAAAQVLNCRGLPAGAGLPCCCMRGMRNVSFCVMNVYVHEQGVSEKVFGEAYGNRCGVWGLLSDTVLLYITENNTQIL